MRQRRAPSSVRTAASCPSDVTVTATCTRAGRLWPTVEPPPAGRPAAAVPKGAPRQGPEPASPARGPARARSACGRSSLSGGAEGRGPGKPFDRGRAASHGARAKRIRCAPRR